MLKESIPVIVKKAAEESKPAKSIDSIHSQPDATTMRSSSDKQNNCDSELKVSSILERKGEFTSNTEIDISQRNSVLNRLNVKVEIKDFQLTKVRNLQLLHGPN